MSNRYISDKEKVGKKFGRLTITKVVENPVTREKKCQCRCDCGNLHEAMFCNLKSGHCKSCGCLKRQFLKDLKKRL